MPTQICHAHCPKGSGHGVVLLVAAVLIIAAVAHSIAHAAEHAADVMLEVAMIAVASLAALAVVAVAAYVAVRVHRRHATARQAIPRQAPAIQRGSQAVSAPQRRAIEAPRAALDEAIADVFDHAELRRDQ